MRNARARRRIMQAGVLALAVTSFAACGGDDEGGAATTAPASSATGTDTTAIETTGSETTGSETTGSETTGSETTGTDPEGATTTPSGVEDGCTAERVGGSVTMGVYSQTAGLDPTVSTGGGVTGATELTAIYDTLMQFDEADGGWTPRLAESLEPNADATEWTLTLRDGIEFGNGDPLTTEAVRGSIQRHQADTTRIRSRGLTSGIADMVITDDHTMVFHLSEPWGSFPYLLAGEVGMIVNPAVVEAVGPEAFNLLPAGGGVGPYEPVSFTPGDELVLEAKDDYWGGPVCIEELHFVAIAGAQATYDAFRNDELDVAFLRGPRVIAEARADGVQSFTELLNAGAVMLINSGAQGTDPPTADVRLRLAIAQAIDPAQIDQRAYEGAGLPTSAVVHPGSRYFTGAAGLPFDPARAAELVEEVKADGWDGSLELACDNTWTEEALSVEAQLEAVGIQVNADITSTVADRIQRVIVDHDYDMACWGMSLAEASPWAGLARTVSTASGSGRTGYSNPEMDAGLDALKGAQTIEDEQAALATIQRVWNETMPTLVTAATEEVIIWSDEMHGLSFNQETVTFFDDAYLD